MLSVSMIGLLAQAAGCGLAALMGWLLVSYGVKSDGRQPTRIQRRRR